MLMELPAPGLSPVQAHGARPPGLPQDMRLTQEWEQLRRAIYARAMRFSEHLNLDFRELLTDATHARKAGVLMWRLIKAFTPEVLVGPGFGATPLLYATAMAALDDGVNLQVLMVRDKRKEHNQKRWVEGYRDAAQGKRAVVLDDFMKSGSALPLVQQALADDKVELQIAAVALFFDMWEPLGSRQISTSACPVVSLFTRHDVGLSRDSFDAVPPLMKGGYPDLIGKPLWWRFELNDKTAYPFKSVPVIADDAVFVADDHPRVWRHDAATGAIEWRYDSLADPLKGIVQRLQYAEGSLVFGCYDGTVTRLDARTGKIIWRRRQDTSIHATPWCPVELGRHWIVGSREGHLAVLDPQRELKAWEAAMGGRFEQPPAVGQACGTTLLAAASNDQGLKVFEIDRSTPKALPPRVRRSA